MATYDVTETAGGGTTRMSVWFEGIEYLSPQGIGATGESKRGQFVRITLTVKNVGTKNASFCSDGKIKWESDSTAPQVVTTTEGVREGADLNTTYKSGQSLNGSFNLDVGAREGKVAYWQNLTDAQPSFVLSLSRG
ncbi:hypothetical protein [Streptomyces tubercidicus]|uniref:hypothetical protein n=1 Tax=Streptomyces tubercidicus TaxID=47759 RepID=UPI002E1339E3|nr:hypothetical protein OG761_08430 [Streptomyces tubercidicus]WSX23430.1 hypothetical protein OG690_28835 [Streptomyces tubercidicus]